MNTLVDNNTANLEGVYVLSDGGCLNMSAPVNERHMYGSFMVGNKGKWVESRVYHTNNGQRMCSASLKHRIEFGVQEGWASSNYAELLTMNEALTYLLTLAQRSEGKVTHVTVLCDSQTALAWADGTEPAKNVCLAVRNEWRCNQNLLRQLKEAQVDIHFLKVDEAWVKTQIGH